MNPIQVLKLLLVGGFLTLVTGCKLITVVVEGGDVESPAGITFCAEGNNCSILISDPNFSQSFVAVPKPGYEFVKWQAGDFFVCGDSTDPMCTVTLNGNNLANATVASYLVAYAMPIWKDVGIDTDGDGIRNEEDEDDDNDGYLDPNDTCPLDATIFDTVCTEDIVVAVGKEWAQPDLFVNLDWNEINAVCPAGVCSGMLQGYNMTGWIWASQNDLADLFNYYIGSDVLNWDMGYSQYNEMDSVWAPAFFADGWRATRYQDGVHPDCIGWLSTEETAILGQYAEIFDRLPMNQADAVILGYEFKDVLLGPTTAPGGAWFYQAP